jgi:hypothetical protein
MSHRFTDDQLEQFEAAAKPCSEVAKTLKRRCEGCEPPVVWFIAEVDACMASVAAGEWVTGDYSEYEPVMRSARLTVADYRQALSRWLEGWERWKTRHEFLLDEAVVDEVYDTLGDVKDGDEHQKSVIAMMVARLDPVTKDASRPEELHRKLGTWDPPDPANTEELLFHAITRLDLDTWKIVPNIRAMIRNVAARKQVAEEHCWIGNPADIPALRLRVKAMHDWFEGKTDEPDTRDIVATLGDPEAYKEKRWLAATLLNALDAFANDERVLRLMG